METLKLNSALGALRTARISGEEKAKLVSVGQALVLENIGMAKNDALLKNNRSAVDYGSSFQSRSEYDRTAAKWGDDVFYYCAKKANDFLDKPTDRNDRSTFTGSYLATNPMYIHTLSSVMNEVMYTITPYLISEIVGEMCSVVTTPKGQTYQAAVTSNAVIQWYDSTWTSLRSVPQDKLYNKTITLNPKPFAARATVNYYQMVGNGMNLVDTMAALAGGYAAAVMQKFTTAFTEAASNAIYVPSALTATGYTSANWATICNNVCKANRVRRDQLIGYGNFLALRNVLPDNATLAPAIMMLLGNEYFKNGYIESHDGVMLYEITPTSTPQTINTTLVDVFPTDQIIIAARAGTRWAPMILCWEDGGDAQITLTPGDDIIATGNLDVLQVASADLAPAFAARIGLITDITNT